MKIRSSPAIPSLLCPGVALNGLQYGHVVRILDSDTSAYINYVLQAPDGTQYSAQMDARRRRNRNALLRMALESGRSVIFIGGINSYVRSVVVEHMGQAEPHKTLAEDEAAQMPPDYVDAPRI